jgi:hypothetical protein
MVPDNALTFAISGGNLSKGMDFQWDPAVVSFCNTLQFLSDLKVMNLLRGHGNLGTGRGGAKTFNWDDYNIPLPSMTSRKGSSGGYSTKSGVLRPLLVHAQQPKGETTYTHSETVYPFSLAMDGSLYARQGRIEGTNVDIDTEYVENNAKPNVKMRGKRKYGLTAHRHKKVI